MPFSGARPLRSLRRTWSAVLVGLVALAVVVGALAAPGFPAADLRLHDASVFVVNRSAQLLGKFSDEADELSSSATMANKDFDVIQDEKQVIIRDLVTNTFQPVDSGSMILGTPANLPADARVSLAGSTVGVSDPATGGMWVRSMDEAFGVDYSKTKPDVDLGPGGQVVLAADGTPYGVSVERSEVVTIEPDGTRTVDDLPFDLSGRDIQVSVVGDRPVVLDRGQGVVWVSGDDPVPVESAADAELQAPSASALRDGSSTAVVATARGLYGIGHGEAVELAPAEGLPTQPVVVEGCFFGAWNAGVAGTVAQGCGEGVAKTDKIPDFDPGSELAFRVNRNVVVLNDMVKGNVWQPQEQMKLFSDWTQVAPPEPEEGKESEDDEVVEEIDPNRGAENRPPVAEDDQVSVRAGRATILPLLDNDSDPDGDILTFTGDWTVSGGEATVTSVRGGAALQIDVPDDTTGQLGFGYTVDDGRGGTDQARVSVTVLSGTEENSPPVQKKREPLVLPQNGTASKRVLLDWRDPEGDDLLLVDAEAPGEDEVTWTPDGELTFIDAGLEAGRKEIKVKVSDGQATTEGALFVDVRKSGSIPPKANGDFRSAAVGEKIVVDPLANDEGEDLLLATVAPEKGGEVKPNYDDNTFTFKASSPGSYYVGYVASNGPTDFGLVRIDVREETEENRPPVAARDVALLPAGGSVLLDPLANDEDADNDVLVLQSVDAPPGVEVRQVQRHLLEISAESTPSGPVSFGYTVSDGFASAQGTIVVMPVRANDNTRPVAVDDEVMVRAGDATSVRVLENDSSPLGLPLDLDTELPEGADGAAWVDGEYVRFQAPEQTGEHRVVYQVRDSQGQTASAAVRFTVTDREAPNTPPEPRPVTSRVLAGTQAKLLVDLRGIDPEGDSVRLVGIDSGPSLGRVTRVGESWLAYEAYEDSAGTDTFRYRVVDSYGAEGTAEIRVGVVPRAETNTPPTTVDDAVVARPGRLVRVPALDNDSDADGDAFGYDADALDLGDTEARLVDNVIEFRIPEEPGSTYGSYGVVDDRGAEATGRIKITSDPDAPLLSPVAVDDVLTPLDVAGKESVEVPVLDNDYDPDGSIAEATVSLPGIDPEADGDQPKVQDNRVIAPVTDRMQVLRYQVTDIDDQVAWALITIPGRADAGPALKADVQPQEVLAGEQLTLAVNDHVIGADGGRVQLTSQDRVWSTHGSGEATSKTELGFTAPPDYIGPASISFEVTDASASDDQDARTAVLTVPITVLPNPELLEDNQPPEVNSVSLSVGAGEDPDEIDLARTVRDPEQDELTFAEPTGDLPDGVEVSLDGSTLTAAADAKVEPGTSVTLTSVVSDGTNEVELPIEIRVQATSRPQPQAADDVVPDAVQGQTTTVPVLDNDLNPFPDTPLKIVRTSLESGGGNIEVRGNSLAITPAESAVGTMVVRYVVRDATDTAERESEARVRLTVKGKPAQPGTPRRGEVGNREAVITWTAPDDNGSPITGYTVTATGSQGTSVHQNCATTTCTITDLVNNESYRFRVVATNDIGDSEPSAASAEIRPDVRPGKPAAPRGEFGDREITFTWTPPKNEGSPINGYDLQLQGPEGVRKKSVGNVRTYTWGGLKNGSSYVLRIRAKNKAPEPSEWSARSKSVVPAGPPSPPRNVAVKDADPDSPTGGALTLSWQNPARNNGDAVDSYRIYQNGSFLTTAGASARSKTLKVKNGTAYRYTMEAVNKAGRGDRSATTPAFTPYGAPKPPTAVKLTPGNKRVKITYSGASSNGAKIDKYHVRLNNGNKRSVASGAAITGLGNGKSYRADVQACSKNKCGSWSKKSNAVTPYGPPNQPTVSNVRSGAQKVKLSWNAPAKSNGRNTKGVQIRTRKGSGGWSGWAMQSRSGSVERGNGYDQTWALQARTVNTEGQTSSVAQTSRKTDAKPKPTVDVYTGDDRSDAPECVTDWCWNVMANVANFPVNTTVTCTSSARSASKKTNGSGAAKAVGPMGFLGQGQDYTVTCSGGGVSKTVEAQWPQKPR